MTGCFSSRSSGIGSSEICQRDESASEWGVQIPDPASRNFFSSLLDKVIVRLPDGMRDRIKAAAESNNRSMNAEIVAVLEDRYPPPRSIADFVKQQVLLDLLAAAPEDRGRLVRQANRALEQAGSAGRFVLMPDGSVKLETT